MIRARIGEGPNAPRRGARRWGVAEVHRPPEASRDPAAVRAPHPDIWRLWLPPMPSPGSLTRGSFKTIPASEETTNTQRFEADSLADETVNGEPVSASGFPANREFNREFFKFGPFSAILASNQRANSSACS